ncbi:MAG: hypothetical protein N5P05_004283 (plasmid) [Chroococcopsis gigantea SAG 12.99]|jgi:hypothetical protein|nr:hypothetical protein [Chroococcopsis gigantea SAG 12.99]
MKNICVLDTVVLTLPVDKEKLTLVEPEYQSIESLPSGQVGTILEIYQDGDEPKYLVEFSDNQGREYAIAILKEEELLVLHFEVKL